jgi:hypothetical protein
MSKINNSLFLFVVLAVPLVTGTVSFSLSAFADSIAGQEPTAGATFTTEGTINTLTGTNYTWLLGGNWNFQSINGVTDSLSVDMTMIASNGTDRHHMLITNFTQSKDTSVNMTQDGNINVNGTSDIYGHGKLKWSSVPTEVSIDKFNVLHMFVDNNQTEDHFSGGVHGITNSYTSGFSFNKDSVGLH